MRFRWNSRIRACRTQCYSPSHLVQCFARHCTAHMCAMKYKAQLNSSLCNARVAMVMPGQMPFFVRQACCYGCAHARPHRSLATLCCLLVILVCTLQGANSLDSDTSVKHMFSWAKELGAQVGRAQAFQTTTVLRLQAGPRSTSSC